MDVAVVAAVMKVVMVVSFLVYDLLQIVKVLTSSQTTVVRVDTAEAMGVAIAVIKLRVPGITWIDGCES